MPELYLCLNCCSQGTLNRHGRCEVCDSDAVVSLHAQNYERRGLIEVVDDYIARYDS